MAAAPCQRRALPTTNALHDLCAPAFAVSVDGSCRTPVGRLNAAAWAP